MNIRLWRFQRFLGTATALMIFSVVPISSYSEPFTQLPVHEKVIGGGSISELELQTFGRVLDPAEMVPTDIDEVRRGTLEQIRIGYMLTGQSNQDLRLCRVKEAIAKDDFQRVTAHNCKMSALEHLGRFTELEELLLSDLSSAEETVVWDWLPEIRRWLQIGELAMYQGEISAGTQAFRTILDKLGPHTQQSPVRSKRHENFEGAKEKDPLSIMRNLEDFQVQAYRFRAMRQLALIAYYRQDLDEYLSRVNELLEIAATDVRIGLSELFAMEFAPSIFELGDKKLAVRLAQDSLEVVKDSAGFKDQPEPLVSFSAAEAIPKALGDERTTRLHVKRWLKLARVYMLLNRKEEATRLLAETVNLASRYTQEESDSNTLVAEVEEAEADLMSQAGRHAIAVNSLRSARQKRQLATQTERSSSLGRRHLEFASPLLAVNAKLLAEMALATPMPITETETIKEILSILEEFNSSRVDQSLRQASRISLEQNHELKKLLQQEGTLVDHLIDLRGRQAENVSRANTLSASEVDQTQADMKTTLQAIRAIKKTISSVSQETTLSSVTPAWEDIRGNLKADEIYWQWIIHPRGNMVVSVTQEGVYIQPIGSSIQNIRDWVNVLRDSTHLQDATKISQLKEYPIRLANSMFHALFPNSSPEKYKHWILSPPPPLDGIPWAALVTRFNSKGSQINDPYDNAWLIEDVALTVVPSLETWAVLKRRSASNGSRAFLGVGDPENEEIISSAEVKLKGSVVAAITPVTDIKLRINDSFSSELRAVSAAFTDTTKTILSGSHATKKELFAQPLHEYRAILFSTHGFLAGDIYKAMGPSLLLSAPNNKPRDRFLVTSDIISLSLSADVVFLSACDTSGSDGLPDSEGFSGLTSAFLLAGARSVVATLWPVDKEATSSFVQSAMRSYTMNPKRPFSFSLQEAAVTFIKGRTSGWHHPAFWSPFVIVGG